MVLRYASADCAESVYMLNRKDVRLVYIARLRCNSKVKEVRIRDILYVDDAALVSQKPT